MRDLPEDMRTWEQTVSKPALRCHPDRKLYAKGRCRSCYEKHAKKTKAFKPAPCHPTRRIFAKGQCQSCYMKAWYDKHPLSRERVKERILYNAEWARKNPDRHRARRDNANHRRNLKTYGLSEEQFSALLHEQRGACAICRKRFVKRPVIDHDHATGKVRGLLCRQCNSGIGMFGDQPSMLLLAASYLCKRMVKTRQDRNDV